MSALDTPPAFSLADKFDQPSGTLLVTGVQALVRALITQAQLDQRFGVNTGGFVSGYRGSPLGGLDKTLWSQEKRLAELNIRFQPGVNEDLAATAVWGSQQVGLHAGSTVDGVFGMWYGKTPGLDRSCDAIRHANSWGTSPHGGVVLVVGDDPAAKSSSLATQSEFTLQDLWVPVLAPANVQDVLDFAVLGWQMSRASGLWVGLKALADHMDSTATVEADLSRYQGVVERMQRPSGNLHIRRQDTPIAQEQRLVEDKVPAAIEFAALAGLNRWVTEPHHNAGKARLGIIAAGKAYADVREALVHLGLRTEREISAAGVELLKLGMTWPLEPRLIQAFSRKVERIMVVEEKRGFVEPQVKDILYGCAQVPVLGKASGHFGETGMLAIHHIVKVLAEVLSVPEPPMLQASAQAEVRLARASAPARQERTPLFCAGCPHNTSTRVPEGSRATAGIGCHYMVQWMDRETDSCTHMGGEGVTWVGEAPFTEEKHIFANLGDGTYFHSGLLAIRQAVAAGLNITYKILFNDAVAMTGGQPTDGKLDVADVIRQVTAEGVAEVVVVSDEPQAMADDLRKARLSTRVFHRQRLDEVQQNMRTVDGVSILIYQQTCATELRRRRKRGLVEDTKPRLLINQAVCEGCGDCSVQSSCVAIEPVDTIHGTKRKINQTTCNKDLSCATGFCPAFVEVDGELAAKHNRPELTLATLHNLVAEPQTATRPDEVTNILITGVGGTGIVTLSALLAVAARLDNKHVQTLDMTGLAQKGGAVFSHVRVGNVRPHVARISRAATHVLVGCDLVSAASNESLELLSDGSHGVINTHVTPTAEFFLRSGETHSRQRLQRVRGALGEASLCDAQSLCEKFLGQTQQANVLLLGYAFQQGQIPLSLASVEMAFRVNAVAVEENLLAFNLGRIAAANPDALDGLHGNTIPARTAPLAGDLTTLVNNMADHLRAYGDKTLAANYRAKVNQVADLEGQMIRGSEQLARAVAESYAKVLTPKDEYEVARLHLLPEFQEELKHQFAPGAKTRYLLAPPLLGRKKRRFGRWMYWGFVLLSRLKCLRNTPLNLFRFTAEHRRNRFVQTHYEALLQEILPRITPQNLPIAVALARLPQQVLGFGHVKEAKLKKALAEEQRLLAEFHRPPSPVRVFDPHQQAA